MTFRVEHHRGAGSFSSQGGPGPGAQPQEDTLYVKIEKRGRGGGVEVCSFTHRHAECTCMTGRKHVCCGKCEARDLAKGGLGGVPPETERKFEI